MKGEDPNKNQRNMFLLYCLFVDHIFDPLKFKGNWLSSLEESLAERISIYMYIYLSNLGHNETTKNHVAWELDPYPPGRGQPYPHLDLLISGYG